MIRSFFSVLFVLVILFINTSCDFKRAELGSEKNPVKLFFVPSVEAKTLADKSKEIKRLLESLTPYKYIVKIPESYIAVVEAFGSNRVDVAAMNTFGYLLAHDKFGAQAKLTVLRFGRPHYRSAFYVRADSSIKTLNDANDKVIAYVDPASTSGYLLPLKEFNTAKVKPKNHVFAMSHDAVISMLYQGRVEIGAAYYSPPEEGDIQDARRLVRTQYPDVEEKINILKLTEPIPNEPIVFRKAMPENMKNEIVAALIKLTTMEAGKDALKQMFAITNFKKSSDLEYEPIRKMLKALGQSAEKLMSK